MKKLLPLIGSGKFSSTSSQPDKSNWVLGNLSEEGSSLSTLSGFDKSTSMGNKFLTVSNKSPLFITADSKVPYSFMNFFIWVPEIEKTKYNDKSKLKTVNSYNLNEKWQKSSAIFNKWLQWTISHIIEQLA